MALTEALELITTALDCKQYALGIFIDLKKAFDTIDHSILFKKLESYGIRGLALNWVKSYLSKRQQFVQLGDCVSSCRDITCGVPQGSVLGPKLFILYINDMQRVSKLLHFVLFADDTNIFCQGDDLKQLQNDVSREMGKLKIWFDRNKLSLNLSKTKTMLFGNHKSDQQVKIKINGVEIENVTEFKFLGVTIDDKITWKAHIKHIQSKISRSTGIIGRMKRFLEPKILRILYCSLVLPYLQYCAGIWGCNYKTTLRPVIMAQKRALRVIHKVNFIEHTNALFLQSKLLKFVDLVQFERAQVMYKATAGVLPPNIQKLFSVRESNYNLRGTLHLIVRPVRTVRKSFCISVSGVRLWNSLADELKWCDTLKKFKVMLKKKTIEKYKEE